MVPYPICHLKSIAIEHDGLDKEVVEVINHCQDPTGVGSNIVGNSGMAWLKDVPGVFIPSFVERRVREELVGLNVVLVFAHLAFPEADGRLSLNSSHSAAP